MAAAVAAAILSAAITAGEALAALIPTYRQCTIWINNDSQKYTLSNPRMYIYSGNCKEPLTPVIGCSDVGGGVFAKTSYAACGSVGVITYDLQTKETSETKRIAVMFSVPFNFNFYDSWFAVGIFDLNTLCNYDLYYQMYYKSGPFTKGKAKDGEIKYSDSDVTMKATMSNDYTPVIKMQIFE